jgi:hypothetical protein
VTITAGASIQVTDPSRFQDEIAGSTLNVRTKFIIVITLVVNETNNRVSAYNLLKFFVDLIGSGTPTDTDRWEVCEILKSALLKIDSGVFSATLKCTLNDRLSLKRDASYVADLTYPSNYNGIQGENSASALASSLVALGFAVIVAQ